ncbi:MAG: tryptophan-rich sensory protein [Patescibacteria group bacterium]|nr:tryptophan-rich sensory protein [Patescibacteria group bacterium]
MKKRILILGGCILVCLFVGLIGSIFTTPAIGSWYVFLNKPAFNPPAWIFAPVWTLLYILMGIALFLVFRKVRENKLAKTGSIIFVIHLALNASWSIIFFGAKMIPLAFANIVILWLLIVYLIIVFWRIDRRASILLWPYLAWVSFASVLNFSLMLLNR